MEPSMRTFIAFALAACLLATGALAQHSKLVSLEVDPPWSRATPKGAKTGAGYVSIKNPGAPADRLLGGSFADAGKIEIHQMTMDRGVMKMRPVAGGVEIKAGETLELKPDGLHLMFVDLKQPLKKGEQVDGTLEFEKSGKVEVQFTVEGIGAAASKSDLQPDKSMAGMNNM